MDTEQTDRPADRWRAATDALMHLEDAKARRESADREIRATVLAARELGVTWSVIGEVLGVSQQAVTKRFGKRLVTEQ